MANIIVRLSLIYLAFIPIVRGIIGYDCGAANLNVTTISLNKIGDCNIPDPIVNKTNVYLQLLQLKTYHSVHVRECRVEIFREINRCGIFSHTSAVAGGVAEYIFEPSREACNRMQETGRFEIGRTTVDGLLRNSTFSFPISLAGHTGRDGECEGTHYADPYGSWEKVIVQGTATVTLSDYDAQVHIGKDVISLRTGTQCSLTRGSCLDTHGGNVFWDTIPVDSCKFDRYDVLYEGPADKLQDQTEQYLETIYTVNSEDMTFALTVHQPKLLCGYKIIQTQHPKLFILEGAKGSFFGRPTPLKAQDLDLFTYINTKFVYVEKHMRNQLNSLYKDVMQKRCEMEQDLLRNSQTLALIKPEEFAYNYQKGPGYTAVITGEVARLIKCTPVEVKVSRTEQCYQELPVTHGNKIYYLTPKTHILKRKGYEIPCNTILPSMYEVDGIWYKMLPFPSEAEQPHVMTPFTKPTWHYRSPGNLAQQGIYSDQDLDHLRDYIMTPFEQPALVNGMIRAANGHPANLQGLTFDRLLNPEVIENAVKDTWMKMWNKFNSFGVFSAGVLGIIIIIKLTKLIIDTLIQLFALHAVYGCSIRLLGCISNSITSYLLHLASKPIQGNVDDQRGKRGSTKDKDASTQAMMEMEESPTPTNQLNQVAEDNRPYGLNLH